MALLLPTGSFDMYFLLVELLFGSAGVAVLFMAAFIFLACMMGKVSLSTTIIWTTFFLVTSSVFVAGVGAYPLMLAFLVVCSYTAVAAIRLFYPET